MLRCNTRKNDMSSGTAAWLQQRSRTSTHLSLQYHSSGSLSTSSAEISGGSILHLLHALPLTNSKDNQRWNMKHSNWFTPYNMNSHNLQETHVSSTRSRSISCLVKDLSGFVWSITKSDRDVLAAAREYTEKWSEGKLLVDCVRITVSLDHTATHSSAPWSLQQASGNRM